MNERSIPTAQQFKAELKRQKQKKEYRKTLRSTVYILLTVAAVAVLVATLFLPVLQVTGTSMAPTLEAGQIVLLLKYAEFEPGDVVAFYYNNKILLKRVIGLPGDMILIDAQGNVSLNGQALEEPYLAEKSLGQCDLTLPYQVPDGKFFLMGDHRATSADSRSSTVGCIGDEYILGKAVFRVWPFAQFGPIR